MPSSDPHSPARASQAGTGCVRATPLGKSLLPGRLGMSVNGGISIMVLAALVVSASFSRSFSVLIGRKPCSGVCLEGFRKEKLQLPPCGPAPDIRLSYNLFLTGLLGTLWLSTTNPSSSSVSRSGISRLSLISLCVVSGEVLGSSPTPVTRTLSLISSFCNSFLENLLKRRSTLLHLQ